jgi:predicted nuclease of restriction endonuclease-like RecB superfamily
VLTADLVMARARGDDLVLKPLGDKQHEGALAIAAEYIERMQAGVGKRRSEVEASLDDLPVPVRTRVLAAGLRKLLDDRATWEREDGPEPLELRSLVFEAAGTARARLGPGEVLDRAFVLEAVGEQVGLSADELDRRLFCDLKEAQLLTGLKPIDAAGLLAAWEVGQGQAVLLRAVRVRVDVRASHPSGYRRLFRKLKFLRLLHSLHRRPDGSYRIVIDGPASLFGPTTKYGLQLALLLPALSDAGAWSLEADVLWGTSRRPLRFALEGGGRGSGRGEARLPDDVAALLDKLATAKTDWVAEPSERILELPGVGLCVPDLRFVHPDGREVYFEVLGYWSRDAVWKRVELVEQGLPFRVVFAASSRLRVSEAALPPDLPGALLVYKGALIPRAVLAAVERVGA